MEGNFVDESKVWTRRCMINSSVPQDTICWICYCSEADDGEVEWKKWIRPCRCCGSTKWVHQSCLQLWIDEKQQGNIRNPVSCSACGFEYVITYPPLGPLMTMLNLYDRIIENASPYFVGSLLVCSAYWSAVTYGAITVMQVYGHQSGLNVMEQIDPIFLLVGLPSIPVFLIIGKMLRWQDHLLRLWRRHLIYLPPFKFFRPKDIPHWRSTVSNEYVDSGFESLPTIISGALALPTIATICGRVCFGQIKSNILRTLAGGLLYTGLNGLISVYYRELKFLRVCRRQIINFPDPTLSPNSTA